MQGRILYLIRRVFIWLKTELKRYKYIYKASLQKGSLSEREKLVRVELVARDDVRHRRWLKPRDQLVEDQGEVTLLR